MKKHFLSLITTVFVIFFLWSSLDLVDTYAETDGALQTANWELYKDDDQRYFLASSLIEGSLYNSMDNSVYRTYVQAFIDEGIVYFSIYGDEDRASSLINTSNDVRIQSILVCTDSGIMTNVKAVQTAENSEFYLDPTKVIGGMSVNDLILTDLRMNGRTKFWIITDNWNGVWQNSPLIFSFSLNADSNQFRSLLDQAEEVNWGLTDGSITRMESHMEMISQQDFGWLKVHDQDQNGTLQESYYLLNIIEGYAMAEDHTVSPAKMYLFEDASGLFFVLSYWSGESWECLSNNGNEAFRSQVKATAGSGSTLDAVIEMPSNSNWFYFASPDTANTLSADEFIITELCRYGYVDFCIPFLGWLGRSDVITNLYFTVPAYNDGFRSLYEEGCSNGWSEPVAAAPETVPEPAPEIETSPAVPESTLSPYSDDIVIQICSDYINTFNYAVPICEQLYDTVMDESNSILDYFLAFYGGYSSIKALSEFYNAKTVFENINYTDLTPEQQTLYTQTKAEVDSTKAGQIISMIEMLISLGLL